MLLKWIFKQFIQFQISMYRRSGGKTMGSLRGMPLLLLTTVGRKSGKERVTPVMYIRDGESYVITASNAGADRHPDWFMNLQAQPDATVEVGSATLHMSAREASRGEVERLWPQLVALAPFFEDYRAKTTRDIPMVILQTAE